MTTVAVLVELEGLEGRMLRRLHINVEYVNEGSIYRGIHGYV